MQQVAVFVQSLPARAVEEFERRAAERRAAERQASETQLLSRPIEAAESITWGATVRDISTTGLGLSLCFPFRKGAYLALDLRLPSGVTRTLIARVVHAHDQADGNWHIGCEFVKKLSESDLKMIA